jgi:HSP20 family protein
MTLIKWNPIVRNSSFRNEIEDWLNGLSYDLPLMPNGVSEWKPRFEILDTDSSYRLRADLPGLSKKDVEISIADNVLTISGERKNAMDNKGENYSELCYGKFSRSFNLSEDIKEDGIKASMKDGVLAVSIPRVKPAVPKVRKISIK